MALDPTRYADHLRAAYGAEQSVIVKSDGYYLGALAALSPLERTTMIRELRGCGFVADFGHGTLGGECLRIRCIDGAKGKSLVESMNAVEARNREADERDEVERVKKGHKR